MSTKYTITTLCLGADQMSFINTPIDEAKNLFMEQFGYEPNEEINVYTDGAFAPGDIRGRTSRY